MPCAMLCGPSSPATTPSGWSRRTDTAAQPRCAPLGRRRPSSAPHNAAYCPDSRVRYTGTRIPGAGRRAEPCPRHGCPPAPQAISVVLAAPAFAPLRHRAFRALWIANLASNTGLWIQNTGAGWLMTSLAPSPVMVSLVQAASMLPVFLFALPGGVLADILDRRLTLIAAQSWIAAAGLLLAALAAVGLLGPWGLLALTFAIGAGTAIVFPAWAAATPELVPREDMVQAVALNGVGFNLARALGPALGGFVMAAAGAAAALTPNAPGLLAPLWALVAWRRPMPPP